MRFFRILVGLALCAVILYLATLATRDCSVTPFFAANCLGLRVEHFLHLPFSRLFRALVLEIVGLIFLLALYLIIRFVFPRRIARSQYSEAEQQDSESGSPTGFVQENEQLILSALCQEPLGSPLTVCARSLLAGYRWREPIHEEIFRAIMNYPGSDSAALREQLPALLTRRGFPDFDLERLFKRPAVTTETATKLIKLLTENP